MVIAITLLGHDFGYRVAAARLQGGAAVDHEGIPESLVPVDESREGENPLRTWWPPRALTGNSVQCSRETRVAWYPGDWEQ